MSEIRIGDRVQVFNPDPRDKGTVRGFAAGKRVRVEWDDGTSGYPLLVLLRLLPVEGRDA